MTQFLMDVLLIGFAVALFTWGVEDFKNLFFNRFPGE